MGILSKIENWRLKFFLWIGLPILAAIGVMFGAFDLVPAWQAHNGGGTIGTFTAEREECGRRSCSFHGSWAAADGSDPVEVVGVFGHQRRPSPSALASSYQARKY